MADQNGTTPTIHDAISQAFEQHEEAQKTEIIPEKPIETPETPEQKAERVRDEQGRFAKETVKYSETIGKAKAEKEVKQEIPEQIPEVKRPPRPSSWKKEMWDHWEKLDPTVAEYLNQREQDFAKGVSTYKQEWESAKPLIDAMAQFQPILEQYNIKPDQWISNLGNAHKQLVTGTPEQKLSMFVKLAQDYQVPLQSLFTQGQDGRIYFNPQIQPYQPQTPQPDPRLIVKELLEEEKANLEIQSFAQDKEQYPYFEQVKDTMAGLLQAGQASDLKSAYEKAIRLDDNLFQDMQKQQREKEESQKREQTQKVVQGAKAKAVSTKSSTPVGTSTKGERKGLRDEISSNFDEIVSERL